MREALARARSFLDRKGLEAARLESELLMAHALGLDRLRLFLELDRPLSPREVDRSRELLVRRAGGEPTAYLIGLREFYGRDFEVGPGVLIPRPETELLVDRIRELAAGRSGLRVAEFGAGSGCIAVTLALELVEPEVVAVELEEEAFGFARRNAERHGVSIRWLQGDGWEPLREHGPYDVLVSNPPYVDPGEREGLAPELRYEPERALFAPQGEPDHWVRRLSAARSVLLVPGGRLLCELGVGQAERLGDLDPPPSFHRDLEGRQRILEQDYPLEATNASSRAR